MHLFSCVPIGQEDGYVFCHDVVIGLSPFSTFELALDFGLGMSKGEDDSAARWSILYCELTWSRVCWSGVKVIAILTCLAPTQLPELDARI